MIRHFMNLSRWKDRKSVAANSTPHLRGLNRRERRPPVGYRRSKVGNKIPVYCPCLAQGLGQDHPVLCLRRRDPEDHLHHKSRGLSEPSSSHVAENHGLPPGRGGRAQADLPGHLQLRYGQSRRTAKACCLQSADHNVRRKLRRLTVSENRIGPVRYTKLLLFSLA